MAGGAPPAAPVRRSAGGSAPGIATLRGQARSPPSSQASWPAWSPPSSTASGRPATGRPLS